MKPNLEQTAQEEKEVFKTPCPSCKKEEDFERIGKFTNVNKTEQGIYFCYGCGFSYSEGQLIDYRRKNA